VRNCSAAHHQRQKESAKSNVGAIWRFNKRPFIIEASELGLVTSGGKVVWGRLGSQVATKMMDLLTRNVPQYSFLVNI
jgi:hypothetical protein